MCCLSTVGHRVVVAFVAFLERCVGPFAAPAVLHAVAGAVLEIVGRTGDHQIDRQRREAVHDLHRVSAVHLVQPRLDELRARSCDGLSEQSVEAHAISSA